LTISGMADGGGFDCPALTGCASSQDCASNGCVNNVCQ
jgi:hypothetical protein